MSEEKLYLYGPEEADEMFKTAYLDAVEKKYGVRIFDVEKAKAIMLKYRKKNGLGTRVAIKIKQAVNHKRTDMFTKKFSSNRCPYTGLIFGRYLGLNSFTNGINFLQLELLNYREFNLEETSDAQDFMIIRLCPFVEGSPTENRTDQPCFWEIIDQKARNMATIGNVEYKLSAFEKVRKMKPSELFELCRITGMAIPNDYKSIGMTELLAHAYQCIEMDVNKFITDFRSGMKDYRHTLVAGQVYNVVTYNPGVGYFMFGNNKMGVTLEDAIQFLQTDKNGHLRLKQYLDDHDVQLSYFRQMDSSESLEQISEKLKVFKLELEDKESERRKIDLSSELPTDPPSNTDPVLEDIGMGQEDELFKGIV